MKQRRRRGAGRAHRAVRCDHHAGDARHPADAFGCGLAPLKILCGGRSLDGGAREPPATALCFALEHVRANRDDGVVGCRQGRSRPANRDRAANRQHAVLRAGRCAPAGPGWSAWGASHRRRRVGAGISASARAHARTLCGRSVRREDWCANVSHRRPSAAFAGRHARIPRPSRLSSKNSRPPHRAGRNRSGPRTSSGRAALRGHCF